MPYLYVICPVVPEIWKVWRDGPVRFDSQTPQPAFLLVFGLFVFHHSHNCGSFWALFLSSFSFLLLTSSTLRSIPPSSLLKHFSTLLSYIFPFFTFLSSLHIYTSITYPHPFIETFNTTDNEIHIHLLSHCARRFYHAPPWRRRPATLQRLC